MVGRSLRGSALTPVGRVREGCVFSENDQRANTVCAVPRCRAGRPHRRRCKGFCWLWHREVKKYGGDAHNTQHSSIKESNYNAVSNAMSQVWQGT